MLSKLAAIGLASFIALPVLAQTPAPATAPAAPRATTAAPSTSSTAAPSTSATPATRSSPSQDKLVDVNSAPASELDALPGIGKARAASIIKGRPYKGKDDLVNRHVIPQNVYDGIKEKIIARQS
jgi:competence protein ComEA